MLKDVIKKLPDVKVVDDINNAIFKETDGQNSPELNVGIVYAAYIIKENKIKDEKSLVEFIEKNVSLERSLFIREVTGDYLTIAFDIAKDYKLDELKAFIFYYPQNGFYRYGSDESTPESISKLAIKLLDVKDEEVLADFGSGLGNFLIEASNAYSKNLICGSEINTHVCEVSRIRTEVFAENVEVFLEDILEISEERKYDKIFSNYPFGVSATRMRMKAYASILGGGKIKLTSSDWIFNSEIIKHIKDSGKAVAIMTNGSTWNSIDKQARETFIREGLIETVIALPDKLFETTSIPTTLMVFSKGNKTTRLIDATNICEKGRRQNVLTDADIKKIIALLNKDGEEAITVSLNEFEKNDFVLNPSRYLEKAIEFKNAGKFEDVIKRIGRGAQLNAKQLDELMSTVPTDTQYLMLSNIQNGMISEELPYLSEFDAKLEKYCIHKGNIVMSKNGYPFKVAVAEFDDDKKVVGNGNLFIIEVDEEKADPYYLKAFFDSEVGIATLKSIVVGATIPNISAESLKNLMIPLPSIEEQRKIAELYQAKVDEIKVLQLRISKAQSELKEIFKEEE